MSKQIVLSGVVVANAQYDATVEVEDSMYEFLAQQGLLRVFQGAPSGKAEKALAYPTAKSRPKDFERKSIPFSKEFEAEFTKQFLAAELEIGRDEKNEAIKQKVVTTGVFEFKEYTGSGAVEPKYKAERDYIKSYLFVLDGGKLTSVPRKASDGTDRTIALFCSNRGLATPSEPWEEDMDFLKEVKTWWDNEKAKED